MNTPFEYLSELDVWEHSTRMPSPTRSEGELRYGYDGLETSPDPDKNHKSGTGTWTPEEHKRFLEALKIYVNGPWKFIAEYVGTRTVRQTMTHAQKYRQKAARRNRGLRTKQAILRMHRGHEVTEESIVQECIREAYMHLHPYVVPTCFFPLPDVKDVTAFPEVDMIEGVSTIPTLEECASVLLDVFF